MMHHWNVKQRNDAAGFQLRQMLVEDFRSNTCVCCIKDFTDHFWDSYYHQESYYQVLKHIDLTYKKDL